MVLAFLAILVPLLAIAEPIEVKVEEVRPLTIEEKIGIPILVKIARCESTLRHFKEDGSIVKGIVDPRDTGLFQINTYYHLESSQRLGMDIYTEEGNIKYAKYLYEQEGTKPWNASAYCWR